MSAAWPSTPLSAVLKERRETPADFDLFNGTVRIVDKVSFNDGRIHLRHSQDTKTGMILVRPGDLLVSGINAAKGAIALHENLDIGPLAATIHYGAYQVDSARAETKFLWWMLRSKFFREILSEHVPGGIKTELKAKRLLPVPVPLPPLDDQRRIVARIEEMAAKVEEARGLRRTSLLEAEILYDVAITHLLPSQCRQKAVGEIIGPFGLKNGKSIKSVPAERGIRCLTLSALRDGRIDVANSKPIPMEPEEAQSYLIEKGHVFIVRGNGSKELCGRAGLVTDDPTETIFPDLFIRVSLPHDLIDPNFFVSIWNSSEMRRWIEHEAKTTSGIWKINQGHIESARIPLPSLSEQHRIVAELAALQAKIDAVKALQTEAASELDAMLPAILDKAFKGEL